MSDTSCYILHCKLRDGDAYAVPFIGYEDLGDVLAEIDALSVAGNVPWAIADINQYTSFGVFGAGDYLSEFAVTC